MPTSNRANKEERAMPRKRYTPEQEFLLLSIVMVTLRLPIMNIFIEEGIDYVNLLGLAAGMGI